MPAAEISKYRRHWFVRQPDALERVLCGSLMRCSRSELLDELLQRVPDLLWRCSTMAAIDFCPPESETPDSWQASGALGGEVWLLRDSGLPPTMRRILEGSVSRCIPVSCSASAFPG